MALQFTGERYHPTENGPMRYEHMHRYALCDGLARNRRVLDIASGEGYGSALLARHASTVVGVDIDREAIQHAASKYSALRNLEFRHGQADAIPLPDDSIDLVVSFETIEHHDRHEEMLLEIRRVLAPGGMLLISSPDKHVYSELPGYRNAHHVRELYAAEFDALLRRHFNHVRMYGQRLVTTSVVCALKPAAEDAVFESYSSPPGSVATSGGFTWPGNPVYLIGICSDAPVAIVPSSLFVANDDDIYREQYRLEDKLREMQAGHEYLAARASTLENELAHRMREAATSGDQVTGKPANAFDVPANVTRMVMRILDASRRLLGRRSDK